MSWLNAFKSVKQNEHAAVMVWGKYSGSILQPGVGIVNPVGTELRVATTALQTAEIKELKLVDAKGNPIMISGNIAFQIYSVKKARVDVVNAEVYVKQQGPMILRKVASKFSYDSLRCDHSGEVERGLRNALQEAVAEAGIRVLQFGLTDLSYAP